MKTPEYTEGPKATERFEEGMKALFRVSKDEVVKREKNVKQKQSARVRKMKRSDKD